MGFWDFVLGRPTTFQAALSAPEIPDIQRDGRVFEVSIPHEVFGIESGAGSNPISPVPKVSRESARQVPAVKKARDLICGTLGGIPLRMVNPDNEDEFNALLDQPEKDVPRSVTMIRLYEDLFYEGIAWWKRTENDYKSRPAKVKRIAPSRIEVKDGEVWLDGRKVSEPGKTLIRFDSPNEGILTDGARAIRTLLRLEAAAAVYASDPMPQGYFSPTEGADPIEDDEIVEILTDWKLARQRGATGYVPAALRYNDVQFSPEQLQLSDARQKAVLEIARITGIDAEDLSVSTTSRTYFNGQDRRIQRINDVLSPYTLAVTDRLRMQDITPRGYAVRADYNGYLRADDSTRLDNYQKGRALGLYTLEDIAKREGVPVPDEASAASTSTAAKQAVREAEKIAEEAAA